MARQRKGQSGSVVRSLVIAGGALLACGVYLAVALYLLDGRVGFPLDDSWIHLAFAQNLAAGDGLSINPGEPVSGSTAPLWTALVGLGLVLPVRATAWMLCLGIACHVVNGFLTWRLGRRLGLTSLLAALAAVIASTTGWLVWSALSGMEIPLFVLLTLWGIELHLGEREAPGRAPLSLAVLGVAILARPEGLLLLLLALADRFGRLARTRDGWLARAPVSRLDLHRVGAGLGLAVLAVLPTVVFYVWAEGSPLPTTLAAKTGGGTGIHLPSLQYLHLAFGILFRAQPWLALFSFAGVATLIARAGTERDRGLLPALWLLGLPLAYSCLTPPEGNPLLGNFGRYMFPLLPIMILLGVLGLEPLFRGLGVGRSLGWGRRGLAGLALAVLLWPSFTHFATTASLYGRNVSDVEAGDVRMARWLAQRLPQEAVLATPDLGAMAALLPNRIVDIAGIADPEIVPYVHRARSRGGTWQDAVMEYLADRKPDYLVVFPAWLPRVERPEEGYRRIHTIHVPGNVTLARDTLALYSTPWSRYHLREPSGDAPEGKAR